MVAYCLALEAYRAILAALVACLTPPRERGATVACEGTWPRGRGPIDFYEGSWHRGRGPLVFLQGIVTAGTRIRRVLLVLLFQGGCTQVGVKGCDERGWGVP